MLLEMVDLPSICVKRPVLRICFVLWLITFWLGLNVVCEMIDLLIVCWFVSSAFTSLHLCIFLGIFNGNFAMKQVRWLEINTFFYCSYLIFYVFDVFLCLVFIFSSDHKDEKHKMLVTTRYSLSLWQISSGSFVFNTLCTSTNDDFYPCI